MAALPDPLPVEQTLDGTLGFEHVEVTREKALARFPVENRVRQPYGIVHGGAYAAMGESLASWATFLHVAEEGLVAVGQSNHTSFFRPIAEGHVHAEAHLRHRGRTTWVWEVDFTDDAGNLCAATRMTIAVRPLPGGGRAEAEEAGRPGLADG